MQRLIAGIIVLAMGSMTAHAQTLEDLNIQIHGYATQGFLYSSANNFLTATTSNGSPAWSEAVINLTSQPISKLRIGVQGRYLLLGNLSNAITLDWAAADYKFNEKLGVRFGKVKTPFEQFNELQDIDTSYIWALLPQSMYPLETRNFSLAHYGGVVYGTINAGPGVGKFEYRALGGERVMASNDGFLLPFTEAGVVFANQVELTRWGGSLKWRAPVHGLSLGASNIKNNSANAAITDGALSGTFTNEPFNIVNAYGTYEKGRFMVAGEYKRIPTILILTLALPSGPHASPTHLDQRPWYGMTSYKVTDKLTFGVYDTQQIDHQHALGPARYFKDWVINAHYDFNQYLYAKAEEHFIEGTSQALDHNMNLLGLQPNSKLTVLKLGVTF